MLQVFVGLVIVLCAGRSASAQTVEEVAGWIEAAEIRQQPSFLDKAERLVQSSETQTGRQPWPGYLVARLLFARSEVQRALQNRAAADDLLDKAIAQAETATKQQPELARNFAALADILGRKVGLGGFLIGARYGSRVEAALRRAQELGPDDVDVHLTIGRNRYHTPAAYGGNVEEAIKSFRRAVARDPKRAAAHFWLGRALERAGSRDEAISQYRKALELDGGYVDARARLEKLLGRGMQGMNRQWPEGRAESNRCRFVPPHCELREMYTLISAGDPNVRELETRSGTGSLQQHA